MDKKKYTAHIVSHTHWDREWYMPFEKFRMRLVNLINELIDIFENEPDYIHFHLDGQSISIEDYIEIHPEKKEVFAKLISEGKISIGPWYVLPDSFLQGAESAVRNLMIGRKIALDFAGKVSNVGYLPDTFGHISQMPQILKKSGFDYCIVWRGINGDDLPAEFEWNSPDGSSVLVSKFSDKYGYFGADCLEIDIDKTAENLKAPIEERKHFATTSHLLLMNGFDHRFPDRKSGEIIKSLASEKKLEDVFPKQSSLEEYFKAISQEIDEKVFQVHGEFTSTSLSSYGMVNAVVRNVLSSRMYLKLLDFENEQLIKAYAEPLMSLYSIFGGRYEKAFLNKAWRYLLSNHPHDSICGCSVDETHQDMEARYRWVSQIAGQCRDEAMYNLGLKIDTSEAPSDLHAQIVHVFNTLAFKRENITVRIHILIDKGVMYRDFRINNSLGQDIPFSFVLAEDTSEIRDHWGKWPQSMDAHKIVLDVMLPVIDGLGVQTLYIVPDIKTLHKIEPAPVTSPLYVLENENLRATIKNNGTIDMSCKKSGKEFFGLHYIVDDGDIGDEYVYSPPYTDRKIYSHACVKSIDFICDNEIATTYKINYSMPIPSGATEKGERRLDDEDLMEICTEVTLKRYGVALEFVTTINNLSKNHRVRVGFPTGLTPTYSLADSNFDIVKRKMEFPMPSYTAWLESETAAFAQKRFTIVEGENESLAVMNKGIAEYELHKIDGGTLFLTLLRCVDRLGSIHSRTVLNPPGPYMFTAPEAQCFGDITLEYAVCLDNKENMMENISRYADEYITPLCYIDGEKHEGTGTGMNFSLEIDSRKLSVSALKQAESEDGIILRLYNAHDEIIVTTINIKGKTFESIFEVNLMEENPVFLKNGKNNITLTFGKKEIRTFKMKFI